MAAFLALGLTPVAMPAAQADWDFDFVDDLADSAFVADVLDPGSWFDPDTAWDVNYAAFATILYEGLQANITDPSNADDLESLNQLWVDVFGRTLIGNGVAGADEPNTSWLGWLVGGDLGDGGVIFGDGAAGAAGMAGGAAGLFGIGGAGGAGADAYIDQDGVFHAATAGGAGGSGGWLFGDGGVGGAGGDGLSATADHAASDGAAGGTGGAALGSATAEPVAQAATVATDSTVRPARSPTAATVGSVVPVVPAAPREVTPAWVAPGARRCGWYRWRRPGRSRRRLDQRLGQRRRQW